jgi:hypothetical protein
MRRKKNKFLFLFNYFYFRSYIDFVKNRADYHTKLLPHDHRSRYEKEKANKIWKNVRPQGNTKGLFFLLLIYQ